MLSFAAIMDSPLFVYMLGRQMEATTNPEIWADLGIKPGGGTGTVRPNKPTRKGK